MLDLAIRHETVITAGAAFVGDMGVEGGQVVSLGRVEAAREEIDATGLQARRRRMSLASRWVV